MMGRESFSALSRREAYRTAPGYFGQYAPLPPAGAGEAERYAVSDSRRPYLDGLAVTILLKSLTAVPFTATTL